MIVDLHGSLLPIIDFCRPYSTIIFVYFRIRCALLFVSIPPLSNLPHEGFTLILAEAFYSIIGAFDA